LIGTLNSAERLTPAVGLSGVMTLTATYDSHGTLTLQGKFVSGDKTLTVTGTDSMPLSGNAFGLTGLAFPLYLFIVQKDHINASGAADFEYFVMGNGPTPPTPPKQLGAPKTLVAKDDNLTIRSSGPTPLPVVKNDVSTAGPPHVASVT